VEQEAFAHYQYRAAKKKFRRFMDKPVRRFRRRIKTYKKKFGKGAGKGGFKKRSTFKIGGSRSKFYQSVELSPEELSIFYGRPHKGKG
jgi:hypothetical protein